VALSADTLPIMAITPRSIEQVAIDLQYLELAAIPT
tara:strand:+ start:1590 stop:1697 length:108 start_codon:yes stop_codon:yes gene_type:complete